MHTQRVLTHSQWLLLGCSFLLTSHIIPLEGNVPCFWSHDLLPTPSPAPLASETVDQMLSRLTLLLGFTWQHFSCNLLACFHSPPIKLKHRSKRPKPHL